MALHVIRYQREHSIACVLAFGRASRVQPVCRSFIFRICIFYHSIINKNIKALANPCSSNPCQNGGICSPNLNTQTYTCTCASGFTGTNCNIGKITLIRLCKLTFGQIKFLQLFKLQAHARHSRVKTVALVLLHLQVDTSVRALVASQEQHAQ
jgi:hypothetical protein